jgi:phage terminase large subunit-like protein
MDDTLHKKLYEGLKARTQETGRQAALTMDSKAALSSYNWAAHARPNQRIPGGDWRIWLILAGRGFGKTRTGAETVRLWARTGTYRRICLLGDHLHDARRVMIEGASGLLAVCSPSEGVTYQRNQNQVRWPNGATATLYSGQAYNNLRGPQFDAAWVDELAKFPYGAQAWDQLMMGLRLGSHPRVIITTTPRPIPLLRHLLQRMDVHVTRGNTFENAANLSPSFLTMVKDTYLGTQLGQQEIEGLVVDEDSRSLWQPQWIVRSTQPDKLERIVVAIDPAVTSGPNSDETGIIVAGRDRQGKGYILEDVSLKGTPTQWLAQAVQALHRHKADSLIAEVNNGGDLIRHLLVSLFPCVQLSTVRATQSKILRAQPIAALYERGLITHVGHFPELEHQMLSMTTQEPSRPKADRTQTASPDRLDALVWALSDLFLSPKPAPAPASLTWI